MWLCETCSFQKLRAQLGFRPLCRGSAYVGCPVEAVEGRAEHFEDLAACVLDRASKISNRLQALRVAMRTHKSSADMFAKSCFAP